jgi:hypothetical protein
LFPVHVSCSADKISVKEAELKILQDEAIALTSWALTWFLGKVIPADLYANMTVLQIHEEMAFAVMSKLYSFHRLNL